MKKQKQIAVPPTQNMPVKQADNKQLKTYTAKEVKELLLGSGMISGDVGHTLQILGNKLLPKHLHGTPKEKREVEKETSDKMSAVIYGFETETHVMAMEGFNERYRGGVKELCNQIILDYKCETSAEKMLAETAANAFMRYLDNSRRLNGCIEAAEYITDGRTHYLTVLSKQIDRSHRQFLASIATLKQLKAPNIEMNIKTNNAFVSQNQQINVPQAPSENNESK